MKPKIRGHHLICLNFFRGKGYSEDFIRNIYYVTSRKELEVVKGPDDVCRKCPYLEDNRCSNDDYTDEKILFQDAEALKLLGFLPGEIVDWKIISSKLPRIMDEWKNKFCRDCGYLEICFG